MKRENEMDGDLREEEITGLYIIATILLERIVAGHRKESRRHLCRATT